MCVYSWQHGVSRTDFFSNLCTWPASMLIYLTAFMTSFYDAKMHEGGLVSTLCMMSSEIALIFSNIGVVPGNFIHPLGHSQKVLCILYMMLCFCMLQEYSCCMFCACVQKNSLGNYLTGREQYINSSCSSTY